MMQATADKKDSFVLETIVEIAREVQNLQDRHVLPSDMSSKELTAFVTACATEFDGKYGLMYRTCEDKYMAGYYAVVDEYVETRAKEQFEEEIKRAKEEAPVLVIEWHRADIIEALKKKAITPTEGLIQRVSSERGMAVLENSCKSVGKDILDDVIDIVIKG